MNKKNLQNITVIFGSIIFIMLVLECALRFINYNPFGEFFENAGRAIFIRPSKNPERLFEATPNTKGYGWGTNVSINRFGFRGREYSLEKPENTYRIVVIGDSIAFGNNLPADKNYSSVLEKMFSKNNFLKNRRQVEVLNLGLGGYDTLQEIATLEEIGVQFKPDLVVVGYCINDIGIASGNLNYIKRLQNYGNPIYHSRLAQFVRVQLDRIELINYSDSANSGENFEASYKNSFADTASDEILNKQIAHLSGMIRARPGKYLFARDYTQTNHIQRLQYGFEKLKKLQEKNSFKIIVLITPYLLEDNNSQPVYQAVYQIIEHEVARLNFSIVNLYPEFSNTGFNKVILKKDDGVHPNALGHEIMASSLYKTIEANGFIK